jgi:tetratricopeptide (TPR) repeat protein
VLSQTIEETRRFADNMFEAGNLDLALPVYQRIAFFSRPEADPGVLNRIADCFYAGRNLEKALEYYDHSYFAHSDDSLKNEVLFQKINCYIQSHNYNFALIELLGLEDTINQYFARKKDFYLGVTWFGLEDFDKSAAYFERVPGSETDKLLIREIFSNKRGFSRPNPRLASWLSVFIPGAGQIYTGESLAGINSFVLTGIFIGLGIYMAYAISPVDAIFTALPWFQRYYQGGFQRAADYAKIKRQENRNVAFNKVLDVLAGEGAMSDER